MARAFRFVRDCPPRIRAGSVHEMSIATLKSIAATQGCALEDLGGFADVTPPGQHFSERAQAKREAAEREEQRGLLRRLAARIGEALV